MPYHLKMMLITTVLSFLFGGGIVVLLAHAVNKQQVIMQEGY